MRLRCKVYTNPETGEELMLAMGMMFAQNKVRAFAMSDDGTVEVSLTVAEWNATPWRWFKDDGDAEAPVRDPRPVAIWPRERS